MAKTSKVLLVTDYFGVLHIVPVGNKSFYQAQNQKTKERQFKFREMEESDALKFVEKNEGSDPDFVAPTKTGEVLAAKDSKIAELEKELEALRAAGTANNAQSSGAGSEPERATELIAKIEAATTVEEVNKLAPASETRVTVTAARDKRLADLKK